MKSQPPPFDYRVITDTIQRSLASAGLVKEAGMMKGITGTIHEALSAAGLYRFDGAPHDDATVIDHPREALQPGVLVNRSFTNAAGTRAYQLYVPASYTERSGESVPLVVMLHGCTQTPEDFAAGTRMNALAELHGFLVAYPAQAANANGAKCWNWFLEKDQERGRGEPSLLAGIAREIASDYFVDENRIFVAGMSAGAAMAVVLGATYPEVFAAVGAHSGLPYRSAHDRNSAFEAMKGRKIPRPAVAQAVPTIVFHGRDDHTVDARNGAAIAEQVARCLVEDREPCARVLNGQCRGGASFTCTIYADARGNSVVEHWELDGTGHAWSGGNANGSFTSDRGPDASAEMLRFFFSQRPRDEG